MTAEVALSTHIVDYDEYWAGAVRRGLFCVICRERFRGQRWYDDQMLISCECPCMCHRHAADRDADGHLLANGYGHRTT